MNREDIVSEALAVLDTWGFEFFSMRRVATALGVQPSALYHHVENKQTLLGLMAQRIVAEVHPDRDPVQSAHRLRHALLSVRDGAEVVATASAFRLGLSDLEADMISQSSPDIARTLLIYVTGHTQMTQLHRQASELGAVETDADLDASFDRGLAIILG